MFLIVGLGNPGPVYAGTRHNTGFRVLDEIADRHAVRVSTRKFLGFAGSGLIGAEKVILLKPQTYMNLSGGSVKAAADYFALAPEQVLVIYDDISLDAGYVRVREKGSAGGHNGMKSIISSLGTQDFPRIRVGIGDKPPGMDLADYVLSHFSKAEEDVMENAVRDAAEAAELFLTQGAAAAMNRYNRKKPPQDAEEQGNG